MAERRLDEFRLRARCAETGALRAIKIAMGKREEEAGTELQALSRAIVDLLYAQACASEDADTEADTYRAFFEMLQRRWHLCFITIYLRDQHGRLCESVTYCDAHAARDGVRQLGEQLTRAVEEQKREVQAWRKSRPDAVKRPHHTDRGSPAGAELAGGKFDLLLERSALSAAVAVPIHAHGELIGALVAGAEAEEHLDQALCGIRFVAPPIVIAFTNARRNAAMREQRRRIECLLEEVRCHSAALEEANRELQRVARYRALFLARMSHELRTPLTAILGFAEILLEQENLSQTQRRFCQRIQDAGLQLQASLEQLVDLSRLEAGLTDLFLHEFSLRELIHDCCRAVASQAQRRGVRLSSFVAPEVGAIVSDESKLRHVVSNFLGHAIGRTPAGASVSIQADRRADCDRFRITIRDQGAPIEDLSLAFDFSELGNDDALNINALGVIIAQRLVTVLGGVVRAAHHADGGLEVELDFPERPA
ncbi:MAG: hypothetical protein C4334_06925 [Pyrinomonas sp.]|uniref:sensor histidine kinase n=1 Tax=Pyrinomonas sp. TaxID=2080306 RepID=UPI003332EA96